MDLEPTATGPGATPARSGCASSSSPRGRTSSTGASGAGTMGFDDVLQPAARRARWTTPSASVVDALRKRFSVVLIDEFQDTDRVQWEIFSTLFGAGGAGQHAGPRR